MTVLDLLFLRAAGLALRLSGLSSMTRATRWSTYNFIVSFCSFRSTQEAVRNRCTCRQQGFEKKKECWTSAGLQDNKVGVRSLAGRHITSQFDSTLLQVGALALLPRSTRCPVRQSNIFDGVTLQRTTAHLRVFVVTRLLSPPFSCRRS